MSIENVIWDWNGTLVADVNVCIEVTNQMLQNENLERLTQQRYKDIFGFPIRDYYDRLGFTYDKQSFEKLCAIFHEKYKKDILSCPLQKGATEIIQSIQNKGLTQFVLSAAEQSLLDYMVNGYSLTTYFQAVSGLSDQFGASKVQNGLQLLKDHNLDPSTCLYVGDTLHDAETANAMGIEYVLLSLGHQSSARLRAQGGKVIDTLHDLEAILAQS